MYIDSSTLILLAKSGLLEKVIKSAKEKLATTKKVYDECTAKKSHDAKLIEHNVKEGKIEIAEGTAKEYANRLAKDFNINIAEAEVIALSFEKKKTLITDDKKAIQACKVIGVEFTTALNILTELYRKGKLKKEMAMLLLDKLKEYGRYSDVYVKMAMEELE